MVGLRARAERPPAAQPLGLGAVLERVAGGVEVAVLAHGREACHCRAGSLARLTMPDSRRVGSPPAVTAACSQEKRYFARRSIGSVRDQKPRASVRVRVTTRNARWPGRRRRTVTVRMPLPGRIWPQKRARVRRRREVDDERLREAAEGGLGLVVDVAQPRLPARVLARPAAARDDRLVAPLVLGDVPHPRQPPGEVGGLLEVARLAAEADPDAVVGRRGLVAELGQVEVEAPVRRPDPARAREPVEHREEPRQVADLGLVAIRVRVLGAELDAVRVVAEGVGARGLEVAARAAAHALVAAVHARHARAGTAAARPGCGSRSRGARAARAHRAAPGRPGRRARSPAARRARARGRGAARRGCRRAATRTSAAARASPRRSARSRSGSGRRGRRSASPRRGRTSRTAPGSACSAGCACAGCRSSTAGPGP